VHGNPVNKAFLQSVFSTCTILFIGFSFTDSYVDGLLDETFHLFSRGEGCAQRARARATGAWPLCPVRVPRSHTQCTRRPTPLTRAAGEEDAMEAPLSYAINADRFGPVGRQSVGIVKAVRGVQYLLYRYDREHSNFLRTLEALRARVEQRLGRG
jgi:hypothetical protein